MTSPLAEGSARILRSVRRHLPSRWCSQAHVKLTCWLELERRCPRVEVLSSLPWVFFVGGLWQHFTHTQNCPHVFWKVGKRCRRKGKPREASGGSISMPRCSWRPSVLLISGGECLWRFYLLIDNPQVGEFHRMFPGVLQGGRRLCSRRIQHTRDTWNRPWRYVRASWWFSQLTSFQETTDKLFDDIHLKQCIDYMHATVVDAKHRKQKGEVRPDISGGRISILVLLLELEPSRCLKGRGSIYLQNFERYFHQPLSPLITHISS